jgi:hypothetical protein
MRSEVQRAKRDDIYFKEIVLKKFIFICFLFTMTLFSVSAQDIYFDAGLGIGKAWTTIDGDDVTDSLDYDREIGIDLGLKLGYGPIANIPLYITGTFGGMGHRLEKGSSSIQFNSYIIGPSVIFYPIPLIQLAGSIGYSYAINDTSLPMKMYDSKGGFAGDVSVAFDFGAGDSGFLLGLKYFGATNTLETSEAKQGSYGLLVFAKYAYRKKVKPKST